MAREKQLPQQASWKTGNDTFTVNYTCSGDSTTYSASSVMANTGMLNP